MSGYQSAGRRLESAVYAIKFYDANMPSTLYDARQASNLHPIFSHIMTIDSINKRRRCTRAVGTLVIPSWTDLVYYKLSYLFLWTASLARTRSPDKQTRTFSYYHCATTQLRFQNKRRTLLKLWRCLFKNKNKRALNTKRAKSNPPKREINSPSCVFIATCPQSNYLKHLN